jgi:hypothetical protein
VSRVEKKSKLLCKYIGEVYWGVSKPSSAWVKAHLQVVVQPHDVLQPSNNFVMK